MRALVDLVQKGGPVMIAILALSVVLYSRCFKLLLALRRSRKELGTQATPLPELRLLREEVHEAFRQQRLSDSFAQLCGDGESAGRVGVPPIEREEEARITICDGHVRMQPGFRQVG
jgi:hypothetical protein